MYTATMLELTGQACVAVNSGIGLNWVLEPGEIVKGKA